MESRRRKMQVRIKRVHLGWTVEPTSRRVKDEIIAHLKKNGVNSDGVNFIQSEDEFYGIADSVLCLTQTQLDDLSNGWDT
jgi:hypothetical protein